jgi:hypothetical protein
MKLTMNADDMAKYRNATRHQIQVSAMRNCRGACKKRRSVAQFQGDSDVCIQCTKRAPK